MPFNLESITIPFSICAVAIVLVLSVRGCDSEQKQIQYQQSLDEQETVRTMVEKGFSSDDIRCAINKNVSELFCDLKRREDK